MSLAGAFNTAPWSFDLRRLDPALYGPVAILPIDHIYAGGAWRTVSIARGPRPGSDHYLIVETLALID
jgi:endonuclease/exonuclease/phosphatase (EEP) superfamily protein YafD